MRPHYSHSSRENATPSSGTSPLGSCKGVPPPPGLRTGYLLIPDDKLIRREILEEAEFYQIRRIVNQLHPPPFLGSKILSDEQKRFILNSCLKLELRHSSFVLIYRASRDGWESIDFHAHCDNKGPTVTVVKSGNYIFGGYTELSWNGKH